MFLRTLQNGPQADLAERILYEVSRARITLLNVDVKQAYDTTLQQEQLEAELPSQVVSPDPLDSVPTSPLETSGQLDPTGPLASSPSNRANQPEPTIDRVHLGTLSSRADSGRRRQQSPQKTVRELISVVLGGAAGVAIAIALL